MMASPLLILRPGLTEHGASSHPGVHGAVSRQCDQMLTSQTHHGASQKV